MESSPPLTARISAPILTALVLMAAALPALANEKPFAPVEKMVKRRTGHSVSWEADVAAREALARGRRNAREQKRVHELAAV